MATSSSNFGSGSHTTTCGDQPNKLDSTTKVDTSNLISGYQAGVSNLFSFYNVREARHVDMRPNLSRYEVETSRNQLTPIEYDRDRALLAASEYYNTRDPSSISWEELRVHVIVCKKRMEFFQTYYGKLPFDLDFLLFKSIAGGPSFNNEYSSWWKDSRLTWMDTDRILPVDEENCKIKFESYNSTFPPFFLIFWKEEPDDYLWLQGDKPSCDPDVLREIEDIVASLSDELLPSGDFSTPDHVTWSPSSSNGFDGYSETKPEWSLEYEDDSGDFIDERLTFARGYALKRPSESRDIGTLTPQSIRLHRTIMYPMQIACRRIKGCVYGHDQPYIRKIVKSIGDSCRYFYMRDYTKSGMTIPHEVICAVLKGFYRRDPKKARRACKAFTNSIVYLRDGSEWDYFHPVTGVPLGMFVEGYTLLQYAMFRYLCQMTGVTYKFNGNNDDCIFGHRSEEAIRQLAVADMELQADLGMSVKGSKTGVSIDKFVYCEEYWNGSDIEPKDSLYALAILGASCAINIVHAKELVYSVLSSAPELSRGCLRAVKYVQELYHWEFSEQETSWPYIFGGWWPCRYEGMDASLLWRNGDAIADCAYWACRVPMRLNNSLKDHATLAFGRKYHIQLLEKPQDPRVFLSLKPFVGTKKCLKDYYNLIARHPREIKRKYHQLYIARRKKFNSYLQGLEDCPSVTKGWIRRHPNSVIIPGMDGVKYSREGSIVQKPRIGGIIDSTMALLRGMVNQGIISCAIPSKISASEKELHHLGITSELVYDFLPMAKEGVPLSALQTYMPGLDYLRAFHGLYVEAIDDDDYPYYLTRHWRYIPIPLVWLVRLTHVELPQPLNESTAQWWFKVIAKKFTISEDADWDPYADVTYEETLIDEDEDFKELLRTLLDSVNIADFKAKVLPQGSKWSICETNLYAEPTLIDGKLYVQTAEGMWLPQSTDDNATSFWDNSDEDDGIADDSWFFS